MFWDRGGLFFGASRTFALGAARAPRLGQYPYPYPPVFLPQYSQELLSPEHWHEEKHCYQCPDGTRRFLTLVEARALGCSALPYEACRPSGLYGRRRLGQAPLGQALKCWRTQDGGLVCTNLMYYSPGCPDIPSVTPEPEILPTPPQAAGAG